MLRTLSSLRIVRAPGAARRARHRRTARAGLVAGVALAGLLAAPVSAEAAPSDGATRIQPASSRYVALGDSYSSGEGGGRPTPETDSKTDRCHRDARAYPVRLSRQDRALRPLAFVACSGAVTSDLVRNNHLYPSEGPQLAALTSSTTTVTITIGGNDAGFAQVLSACIAVPGLTDGRGCSSNPALTGGVDASLAALAGRTTPGSPIIPVTQVLAQIHARSPRAHVYVAAYPELFGSRTRDFSRDATAPSGRACVVNGLTGASFDRTDTRWLNRSTRRLNGVLAQSVRDAKTADRSLRGHLRPGPGLRRARPLRRQAGLDQPARPGAPDRAGHAPDRRPRELPPDPEGPEEGLLPHLPTRRDLKLESSSAARLERTAQPGDTCRRRGSAGPGPARPSPRPVPRLGVPLTSPSGAARLQRRPGRPGSSAHEMSGRDAGVAEGSLVGVDPAGWVPGREPVEHPAGPPAGQELAVVEPAQQGQVVEVRRATVDPGHHVVAFAPLRRMLTPRE